MSGTKLKTVDLSNLSEEWRQHTTNTLNNFKSDDPLVDGTAMTTNPDIRYREKRYVSKMEEGKRLKKPTNVGGLLEYCKWLAGEKPTCDKPSDSIVNVFRFLKNKEFDKVAPCYSRVYDTYTDLFTKAFETYDKLGHFSKRNTAVSVQNILENSVGNLGALETSKAGKTKAEQWLRVQLGLDDGDKSITNRNFCSLIQSYRKHGTLPKYAPSYAEDLIKRYEKELKPFTIKRRQLVKITDNPKEIAIKPKVTKPKMVEPKPEIKPIRNEIDLTLFIQTLKQMGVSEFTLKF